MKTNKLPEQLNKVPIFYSFFLKTFIFIVLESLGIYAKNVSGICYIHINNIYNRGVIIVSESLS